MDNPLARVIQSQIPLERKQLSWSRIAMHFVLLSIPVSQLGVSHHSNTHQNQCRVTSQTSQRANKIFSILEPDDPFMCALGFDHSDWMVSIDPAVHQLL